MGADENEYDEAAELERRTLLLLLGINGAMFVVEAVTGWLGQATGLAADSLDMLADAFVYAIALKAVGRSRSLQSNAAAVSGVLQIALGLLVVADVARRLLVGSEPVSLLIIGIGLVALAANLTCLALISRHREGGIHMRASWIVSVNDVIANIGVIVAGVLVWLLSSRIPDLVIGAAIAVVVIRGGLKILLEVRAEKAEAGVTGSADVRELVRSVGGAEGAASAAAAHAAVAVTAAHHAAVTVAAAHHAAVTVAAAHHGAAALAAAGAGTGRRVDAVLVEDRLRLGDAVVAQLLEGFLRLVAGALGAVLVEPGLTRLPEVGAQRLQFGEGRGVVGDAAIDADAGGRGGAGRVRSGQRHTGQGEDGDGNRHHDPRELPPLHICTFPLTSERRAGGRGLTHTVASEATRAL